MKAIRRLVHGNKALLALAEYAMAQGWHITRTGGGHLKFSRPGCAPVFTSSTPGDHRAVRNARALLRKQGPAGQGT